MHFKSDPDGRSGSGSTSSFLKRVLQVLVLVQCLQIALASADRSNPDNDLLLRLDKQNPFYVLLADNAKDGCWTNIDSVSRNFSGALKDKGFMPVFDPSERIQFTPFLYFDVFSARSDKGVCYGRILVEVVFPIFTDDGQLQSPDMTVFESIYINSENLNEWAIEASENSVREIRNLYHEARDSVDALKIGAAGGKAEPLPRSPKGKQVVVVYFTKVTGEYQYMIEFPIGSDLENVTEDEMHQKLGVLLANFGDDLYTRVFIPEDSKLMHDEAWKFTEDILNKYDYYYQE